jgi:DNA primase
MIDKSTVERITDAADIVEIVGEFVTLKKRGANYLGCCPFHNEKTPSFTVSQNKGIFKCFGCGKSGNSVGFIMEHEGLSYPEALKYIAKKYKIEVQEKKLTPQEIEKNDDRESMLILNEFAAKYFTSILNNTDEGKAIAQSYFRERQISQTMIQKFGLGYSLQDKKALTNEAIKQGYKLKYLEKSGLTIVKLDWQIDRFHSRVMFPIHSMAGKVIGFGGRILTNDKKTAKYLNSPESEVYNKSKVLYGLYQAKREIANQDECFLVEGYTDVISLHQAGIENVVASSGTSLTDDQIRLIRRFSTNVTVLYDGDAAGIKASLRGIDMILAQEMNVKVVSLPEGEDPDSFSKSMSSQDFKNYIEQHKIDFIKFKTQLLLDEAKKDPAKKAEVIKDIVKSISVIPNAVTRQVYINECSEDLNMPEAAIVSEINNILGKEKRRQYKPRQNNYNQPSNPPFQPPFSPEPYIPQPGEIESQFQPNAPAVKKKFSAAEKSIIYLIIKFADHKIFVDVGEDDLKEVSVPEFILNEIELDEIEVESEILNDILNICREAKQNGKVVTEKMFLNSTNEKVCQTSINLATSNYVLSSYWERGGGVVEKEDSNLKQIVEKTLLAYKHHEVCKMLKTVDSELKSASDDIKMLELLKKRVEIKKVERKFAKDLGRE